MRLKNYKMEKIMKPICTKKEILEKIFWKKNNVLQNVSRVFPGFFQNILRRPFLTEHLRWLLLYS